MALFELLVAFVKAVVWIGGWSQLVGMPVAWLRLRRSPAWTGRPDTVRRIDLLAQFIMRPTVAAVIWAWFSIAVLDLGDFNLSTNAFLAVIWGPPTVFVPLAVLMLDVDRLGRIVDEMGRAAGSAG